MNFHPDPEVEWYFSTLAELSREIGEKWVVVMRIHESDKNDVRWYVFPYEGNIEEEEDLSIAEYHPDKLILKFKEGILFSYPPKSILGRWMRQKLKDKPELAGRMI